MSFSDIVGVLIVYLYVGFLILVSRYLFPEKSSVARKFLHIMVGNIIFILPLFDARWVMVLFAAAPFIFLTYLISPQSPLDLSNSTHSSGHDLGLVYYSISWTILALLYFEHLDVIAVGIICMSYGDGAASLVGKKYGEHYFSITRDKKSLEGSISMILSSSLMISLALFYLDAFPERLIVIPLVVGIATIIELVSINGSDNLLIALIASTSYYIIIHLF